MRLSACACVNRLLERLMSPSPKSQVMFASAFSWIGDFYVFLAFIVCKLRPLCWIYEYACHTLRRPVWRKQSKLIASRSRSKLVANDYRHSTGVDFEPNEHAADGALRARRDTTLVTIMIPGLDTNGWPIARGNWISCRASEICLAVALSGNSHTLPHHLVNAGKSDILTDKYSL